MATPDSHSVAVSFGRAHLDGGEVEGFGVQINGDKEVWFLPLAAGIEGGAYRSWIRVQVAAYVALTGPLDERVVKARGSTTHYYELPWRSSADGEKRRD